jgi:hypothetical protein
MKKEATINLKKKLIVRSVTEVVNQNWKLIIRRENERQRK